MRPASLEEVNSDEVSDGVTLVRHPMFSPLALCAGPDEAPSGPVWFWGTSPLQPAALLVRSSLCLPELHMMCVRRVAYPGTVDSQRPTHLQLIGSTLGRDISTASRSRSHHCNISTDWKSSFSGNLIVSKLASEMNVSLQRGKQLVRRAHESIHHGY